MLRAGQAFSERVECAQSGSNMLRVNWACSEWVEHAQSELSVTADHCISLALGEYGKSYMYMFRAI